MLKGDFWNHPKEPNPNLRSNVRSLAQFVIHNFSLYTKIISWLDLNVPHENNSEFEKDQVTDPSLPRRDLCPKGEAGGKKRKTDWTDCWENVHMQIFFFRNIEDLRKGTQMCHWIKLA